ncbi:hypothetical protein N7523_003296 [Penicillium sp. IBT 18751x]|nr:hypothetical protein N7523_003296 [Penicillium sp. IBT 18751x]
MQLITLLPLALSALGLANAAALEKPANWTATGWNIECSPGGCIYEFNITGARTENTPAFSTHCEGIAPNATVCDLKNITARVRPVANPIWNVAVQHTWSIPEPQYNSRSDYWQSGNVNVTETANSFTIVPKSLYGVA